MIVKPIIILISVTVISLIILNRIFRNEYKSAVIFSILILLFFLFSPLLDICVKADLKILRIRYLIVVYILTFVFTLFLLVRARTNFKKISNFLNLASISSLIVILVNLIVFQQTIHNEISQKPSKSTLISNGNKTNNLPNIYYIILDSYAGCDELNNIIGFDNENFMNYLEGKGFLIAKGSRCNYHWTVFSMAATLSMDYLPMKNTHNNFFEFEKNTNYFKKLESSQVVSFLKSLGYQYIDLSIWNNKYYSMDFSGSLLGMTIVGAPFLKNYFGGLLYREYVLSTLKSLERPINIEKPFFLYAHVLIPHFPVMFDEHGNMPSILESNIEKLYIDQLKYTNVRVKAIIESILATAKNRSIIIIQGDHGANFYIKDREKQMKMRTSILNAVYLPDGKENIFYDGMTSLNTFRILFNKYFGTNLKLLPDVTYYQEDERGRLVLYNPN